jgi:hypothetical protein
MCGRPGSTGNIETKGCLMFTRIAKVFLHGMVLALVPLAVSAGMGSMQEISSQEAEVPKGYAFIPGHVFSVRVPMATASSARLVVEDGARLLSCFTDPPLSIAATRGVVVHLTLEGEGYACFEGREALEQLALGKQLVPSWTAGIDPPAASLRKYRGIDGEETDDWGMEQQMALEYQFWGSYGAAGGGRGAQCMSECSTALTTMMRFCAALPDPARELCIIGLAGLYVACIASC